MSFHISFVARSVYAAREKLQRAHAPAAVKALVEKALDAMAVSPAPQPQSGDNTKASAGSAGAASPQTAAAPNSPLFGVLVEVRGSIANPEGRLANAQSEIQRFLVKPLLD